MASSRLVFGRKLRKGLYYFGECSFVLPVDHMKYALEATKAYHYHIVREGLNPEAAMVSMINRAVNFGTEVTEDGDIIDIWFKPEQAEYGTKPSNYFGVTQRRYDDTQAFFQKIAKYVQKDSFILGHTEERYWRWLFNGDCLVPQEGELVFKDKK